MQVNFKKTDTAGAVILYNSPISVLDNIKTYINQIEKLYVVDNSTQINNELILLLKAYPHVHYQSLNGNRGIAVALNWAARQAIVDGYKVLLTMDDDTRTPEMMVFQMIDFWNNYPNPIGILSGIHNTASSKLFESSTSIPYETMPYVMTSGNMLNLVAYQRIGGFIDELFIDHVDNEYGLRLNLSSYQVVELKNIRLDHSVGYAEERKIGKWVIRRFRTHSPVRNYYFMRNGIYVAFKYFPNYPLYTWIVAKEFIYRLHISVLFAKNKLPRIKMLFLGVIAGFRSQLGKYKG